jgi:hypothetical protein
MVRILTSSILSLILFSTSVSFAADNSDLVTCATSPEKCFVINNPSIVIGKTAYTIAVYARNSNLSWEAKQALSSFMTDYCLGYHGKYAGYKAKEIRAETKIVLLGRTLNFAIEEKSSVLYSAVQSIVCIKNN